MTARESDHYDALGLNPSATDEEIKRSYRRLMREAHPDANAGDPGATQKAARLNAAFEVLGNPDRRRAYDVGRARRNGRLYAFWAQQPDWEDIVAEHVPPKRPPHRHTNEPTIDPPELEVHVSELETQPRLRRRITVTNNCDCVMRGDISTSEPWLWGPAGGFVIEPGQSYTFDVEVVASKVFFPGVSRVSIVTQHSSHVVPVNITGYATRARVRPSAADAPWVYGGSRRTKWAKYRR